MSNTTVIEFTRVNNDVNGNPRYVCHFLVLLNANERGYTYDGEEFNPNKPVLHMGLSQQYDVAVKKAHKIGGKRFHNKQYGGGIVFQSYSLPELEKLINEAKNS